MVKSKDYPVKWDRANLEKFGHFIRNLFIRDSPPELNLVCLRSCLNVTNLTCWVQMSRDMMDAMSHLRLTHLSINPNIIQHPTPGLLETFARVTHLDCLGHFDNTLGHIIHFKSLTHLAVSCYILVRPPLLPILWDRFPKLQVVISLKVADNPDQTGSIVEGFDTNLGDPRVVMITLPFGDGDDWLDDVRYGRGIWGLADEAISRRRQARDNTARGIER
ncbi:hypothetical protein BDN72DRAFT_880724 [Pluteus cervinus]|uniref:Uncharacterized protein n=1 Tax=Pluteus cervinus TaxID=181527 RepID=A0ACD3AJ41_9AGAR|nr:hypothetical protein BDN72DRAFT_880724 [Pluteus cervinus]